MLNEEDIQDVASVFFANKAYDKALAALDGQEGLDSLLLIGRIQFDKGSFQDASLTFIKAE